MGERQIADRSSDSLQTDIVTRLEVLAEKLLAQWPEPDDPYNPRVVFDAIVEVERLRAAGDALAEATAWWNRGNDLGDAARVWQEARRG